MEESMFHMAPGNSIKAIYNSTSQMDATLLINIPIIALMLVQPISLEPTTTSKV
jgi:hypothetical protein